MCRKRRNMTRPTPSDDNGGRRGLAKIRHRHGPHRRGPHQHGPTNMAATNMAATNMAATKSGTDVTATAMPRPPPPWAATTTTCQYVSRNCDASQHYRGNENRDSVGHELFHWTAFLFELTFADCSCASLRRLSRCQLCLVAAPARACPILWALACSCGDLRTAIGPAIADVRSPASLFGRM